MGHSVPEVPMYQEVLEYADPRVFVTATEYPDEGRCFVWAKTRWYERVEGQTGAVEYQPVADDDQELREFMAGSSSDFSDLSELDEELASEIREEFMTQTPLYPEAPELSHQRD